MESHVLLKLLTPYAQKADISEEDMLLATIQILASPGSNQEIEQDLLELLSYSVLDDPLFEDIIANREDYVQMFAMLCPDSPTVAERKTATTGLDKKRVPEARTEEEPPKPSKPGINLAISIKKPDAPNPASSKKRARIEVNTAGDRPPHVPLTMLASTYINMAYIPHTPVLSAQPATKLRPITDLPREYHCIFPSHVTHFNRMQSESYKALMESNCNILLSAPTGAGKTICALLCMLRAFSPDLVSSAADEKGASVATGGLQFSDNPSEAVPTGNTKGASKCSLKSTQLVVYLTPMKALASEMTATFTRQLEQLGLIVLECTGDESPPQSKLQEANLLICTLEKWDVLTRKPVGEVSLIQRQTLLVIDEVHLLGVPGRGPILESIVMRTLQYVESSQRFLRIVGISATVPNYRDVAEFLKVPSEGLLYYGQEYRPVPLIQTVVGVKPQLLINQQKLTQLAAAPQREQEGPMKLVDACYYMETIKSTGSLDKDLPPESHAFLTHTMQHSYPIIRGLVSSEEQIIDKHKSKFSHVASKMSNNTAAVKSIQGHSTSDLMDSLVCSIVKEELLQKQNQILVFIHSRTGTQVLARMIGDELRKLIYEKKIPEFDIPKNVLRKISDNDSTDLSQLIACGVAYHNAGMKKNNREVVERLFRDSQIRVVCCTATLAWGINMPCSTVIIRGTEIFSANGDTSSTPTDINILDVQQIFGRAGRPQYTAKGEVGHGIILTDVGKMDEFVWLLNNETNIESHMQPVLPDILNAELILGNVSSVTDCVSLLRWSFLATRIMQLPRHYGAQIMTNNKNDIFGTVSLEPTLREYVMEAVLSLVANKVVTLDTDNEHLFPTEIGRICSYYYVSFRSFSKLITLLKGSVAGKVSHDELLGCLCECPDFCQFKMRKSELEELSNLSGDSFEYLGFYSNDSGNDKGHSNNKSASSMFRNKDTQQFKKSYNTYSNSQLVCRLNVTNVADIDSAAYKVNILLQCFISRKTLRTQSLVTDQRLCVTVAPRILRAFAEAALVLRRSAEAFKLYDLATSIEYQRWFSMSLPFWPIVRSPVGSMEHIRNSYTVCLEAKKRQGVGHILTDKLIQDYEYHRNATDFPSAKSFFSLSKDDISICIHDSSQALKLYESMSFVPRLYMKASLYPVSNRILRLSLSCTTAFQWSRLVHGESLSFVIVVCSQSTNASLHYERLTLTEQTCARGYTTDIILRVGCWKQRRIGKESRSFAEYMRELYPDEENEDIHQEAVTPSTYEMIQDGRLAVVSFPEDWLGGNLIRMQTEVSLKPVLTASEDSYQVFNDGSIAYRQLNDLSTVIYDKSNPSFTPIPQVPPLSVRALHWPEAEAYFRRRFSYFNPLQTVMFHKLFYTRDTLLIGGPTGSGKTVCSELAILQHIRDSTGIQSADNAMRPKIVYIAPMKALIRERYNDWSEDFGKDMGFSVMEITGETLPAMAALYRADIILATPEKFDAISRQWQWKKYIQMIGLIIFDELHLVGTTRGYVLESIICRMRYLSELLVLDSGTGVRHKSGSNLRMIGLSTVSANTGDIARWLNVKDISGIFNFSSAARPVRLETHIQGFPGWHYCPRMTIMNRPLYSAIKKYSPRLPVLIFVASRRQTRLTALALISFAEMDSTAPDYLRASNFDSTYLQSFVQDSDCKLTIGHGIGLHHAGMTHADRTAVEKLYLSRKISVLVATSTLAWGLNLPAFMTVIKGCEYFDGTVSRYVDYDTTEVIQMAGRAGRPQYTVDRLKDKFETGILGKNAYQYLIDNNIIDQGYLIGSGGHFHNKQEIVNGLIQFTRTDPATKGMDRDLIAEIVDGIELQLNQEPQSVCIVFCKTSMKEFYKQFFSEPFPFESSIMSCTNTSPIVAARMKKNSTNIKHQSSHFPDIINAEIASFGSRTMLQLRNWFQNSFLYIRARRNPPFYDIFPDPLLDNLQEIIAKADFENPEYTPSKELKKAEAAFRLYLGIVSTGDEQIQSRKDLPGFARVGVYLITLADSKTLRDFLITQEIYKWIEEALLELADSDLISLHKKAPKNSTVVSEGTYFEDININVKNVLALPTPLGEIVSRYYLRTKSGVLLNTWLLSKAYSVQDYLDILVRCEEFQELPVRHNEDRNSAELLQRFLWNGKGQFTGRFIRYNMPPDIACTEPGYKVYLLLQEQLIRSSLLGTFELPIVDYWLDLATILDAAIRITVATAEVALSKQLPLAAAKVAIQFSQGLVQGLWPDMDARLSIPTLCKAGKGNGKLLRILNENNLGSLQALVSAYHTSGEQAFGQSLKSLSVLSKAQVKSMSIELLKLPNVSFTVAVKHSNRLSDNATFEKRDVNPLIHVKITLKHTSCVPNSPHPHQFTSEIYPKAKPHTWFIIISDYREDAVLKYVRFSGFRRERSHEFVVPAVPILHVCALSDCFVGLDKEALINLSELGNGAELQASSLPTQPHGTESSAHSVTY